MHMHSSLSNLSVAREISHLAQLICILSSAMDVSGRSPRMVLTFLRGLWLLMIRRRSTGIVLPVRLMKEMDSFMMAATS